MKISIQKAMFQKMITTVQGFTERRSTLPILSHILIETYGKGIKIKATDLHLSIQVLAECDVEEDGACALNAKSILDLIRELPDTDLIMKTENHTRARITIGDCILDLNIMDPEEYPKVDFPEVSGKKDKNWFSLPPDILKSMIEKTIFSIPSPSEEEARYTLGGALLVSHKEEGKGCSLEMVTTDGRRLSLSKYHSKESIDMGGGIIIPRKGLQEIKRLIDTSVTLKDDGGTSILLSKNSIFFKSPDTIATVRLIDGKFPDYGNVIKVDGYPFYTKIDGARLLNALKVCSAIVSDASNSVKMSFRKKLTKVYANNPEQGDVEIPIESEHTGDEMEINFNPRYLIDCISQIEGDAVIRLINEEGPCLISPAQSPETAWVIMPMRF
jgi:DNA polymerase-3 subunit beta